VSTPEDLLHSDLQRAQYKDWGRELPVYGAYAVDLFLGGVVIRAANHEGRGIGLLPAPYPITATHLLCHLHTNAALSPISSVLPPNFPCHSFVCRDLLVCQWSSRVVQA